VRLDRDREGFPEQEDNKDIDIMSEPKRLILTLSSFLKPIKNTSTIVLFLKIAVSSESVGELYA